MINYQQYNSQSYYNGGYRYFFNGQEADNEVLGEGASLTAEFWQYDTRLGRRWNVDPVFKEYESPYACFAGNPVWFADPNGDTVMIYNNDKVTKKILKQYFREQFGSSAMFRFTNNGTLLVNEYVFNSFVKKSNQQQALLLNGLAEAIKTGTTVIVKIETSNPNVRFVKTKMLGYDENLTPIYDVPRETVIPALDFGGGATMYSKLFEAYIIGLCEKVANESPCSTGIKIFGIPKNTILYNVPTGNANSAFFHELLDEFLNYYVKQTINDSSSPTDEVQFQNAALENQKLPKRDGEDHER
jgi:hypothetical protein